MSNNAPDYENDLVFPPRHDKTAYELTLENNRLRESLKNVRNYVTIQNSKITHLKEVLLDAEVVFSTYAKEDETCDLEEENKLAKKMIHKIREALHV